MNMLRLCIISGGILLLAQSIKAQVPFIFPGASAFTPEISIVNTGNLLDVQATVSSDRKYVTLNARPQASTLLALRSFNFQQGGVGLGNVGDPPARVNSASGKSDGTAAIVNSSPSDILARGKSEASILHREGIICVSKLKE